jgi:hypothetical protein
MSLFKIIYKRFKNTFKISTMDISLPPNDVKKDKSGTGKPKSVVPPINIYDLRDICNFNTI